MTTSSIAWPAPIPLGAAHFSPWPPDVFPEPLQGFVSELARATETPIELSSLATLSALSAAAQGKYIVQVKPDYYEPVNLWTAVALPSGSRKSAVQKHVTIPLTLWEKEQKKLIDPLAAQIVSENKSIEARVKEIRRKGSMAEIDEYEKLKEEAAKLESQMKEIPVVPQLWTGDITPENLGMLMAENNECMSYLSDEAGVFDILAGRYSSGIPNLDLFLQAHSGSPTRVNRGSRPPVFLNRPALTMGLTPQPDVLRGLAKTPAFRGRGLLARFLFAIPASNLGIRCLDAPSLSVEAQESFNMIITLILNDSKDSEKPQVLKLSPTAFDDWHHYALAIEVRMGDDGPLAHMRDWASKLPGAIARIAALLHVARNADRKSCEIEIGNTDMRAAIKIGHVLSEHAQGVFELIGADTALDGAKTILSWIQRQKLKRFTFRDCHYAHKSKFKRAKEMEPSIEVLEERHFIRELDKGNKPHRPSRLFDVNPQIWQEKDL